MTGNNQNTSKVTLSLVAEMAGVSRGAACAALKGGRSSTTKVSADVIAKVEKVAKKLGYVPDAAARALRSRHVSQIGVILPNMPDWRSLASPQSFETIMGINNELQSGGYVVVLVRLHDILNSKDDGSEGSVLFRERMIDVAIAVGQFDEAYEEWISKRVPKTVWCDGRTWNSTCCVRRDEKEAGRIAVRNMVASGCKSILVLADAFHPGHQHFSFQLRYDGIREECTRLGIPCRHVMWDALAKMSSEEVRRHGILAIEFNKAEQIYIELGKRGIVPGRDVSLAACEDYRQQWWCFQDIARVEFDRGVMGAAAARMALDYIATGKRPESVLVPSLWKNISGANTLMGKGK